MIEINLVPDVKQQLLKAQRIRATVITGSIFVGIASVGIVAALAFYVYAVQSVRSGIDENNITDKNKTLNETKDLSKILTIQNQLSKIQDLNSNKKIDSRIFDLLNAIIPPSPNDVTISDLTIDSSSNTITINGQAANSYAAVEVFKKTIAGTTVQYTDDNNKQQSVSAAADISTSNTSYGEDSNGQKVLRFTLSFTYPNELFSPLTKNFAIKVTVNGNVTDSYLGVPKTIFADKPKDLTGNN